MDQPKARAPRTLVSTEHYSNPKRSGADTQHDIVVDYVVNNAYAGTARVLASTAPAAAATASSSSPTPQTAEKSAEPMSLAEQLAATRADKRLSEAMDVDDENDEEGKEDDAEGGGEEDGKITPAPPLDEEALVQVEQRRGESNLAFLAQRYLRWLTVAIIDYILSGAITRAVDALHAHFPTVLTPGPVTNGASSNGAGPRSSVSGATNGSNGSYVAPPRAPRPTGPSSPSNDHATPVFPRSTDADHVRLNLQIQQFIESFRQIVPSAPSSPTSSIGSLNGSTGESVSVALNVALAALQGLHADASRMRPEHRSVYLHEVKDVGGLLAYTDPENSTLAGFLDQARRVALAQQVNAAILRESLLGCT